MIKEYPILSFLLNYWPIILGTIMAVIIVQYYNHRWRNERARLEIPKLLSANWMRGRKLRSKLERMSLSFSGPAFYALMSDLAREGAVWQKETFESIDGETVKTRWFCLPFISKTNITKRACAIEEAEVWQKRLTEDCRRESALFKKGFPQLLRQYYGEYVALSDGRVLEHMIDEMELVRIVSIRFPNVFVLIKHIMPEAEKEPAPDMDTLDA
jgi:hypothetical protein